MSRLTAAFLDPNSPPVLFILCTTECVSRYLDNYILKFSDDTAVLSLLHKDSDTSSYHFEIKHFVQLCVINDLLLNVNKTEEIICDPREVGDHSPVMINSTTITKVCSYKLTSQYPHLAHPDD